MDKYLKSPFAKPPFRLSRLKPKTGPKDASGLHHVWIGTSRNTKTKKIRKHRKAFQPEFGAYPGSGAGFEIALEPSKLQKVGENP